MALVVSLVAVLGLALVLPLVAVLGFREVDVLGGRCPVLTFSHFNAHTQALYP